MLHEDTRHKRNERKRNNLNIQRGRTFCIIRAVLTATREMDYKSTGVRETGDEGEREIFGICRGRPFVSAIRAFASPVAIRENKTVKK